MTRARALASAVLCLVASGWIAAQSQSQAPAPPPSAEALTVHITSPLGRIGVGGEVRIVAQVHDRDGKSPVTVRFFVDDRLIKVDEDGPPYATEWVDENVFEERKIAVEATDAGGHTARDSVTLHAYEFVDTVQVRSMLLEAVVHDKKGRFISGLTSKDFTVRENGVAQTLDLVSPETIPATFALLVDSSQSMAPRVDFVRLAARRLGPYVSSKDHLILAPFSIGLGPITGPTNDLKTVDEAIGSIKARGGTAILESLSQMAERLNGIEGRHVIVLITDGYDENSKLTVDDTLKSLQEAQVTVYVVGVGGISGVSLRGQALLKRIAVETGGQAFFPWDERDLPVAYDLVATNASNRYLIAYTPSDGTADGLWRAIEVVTRSGEHVVQTRAGYFAPKPPPVRPEIEFTLAESTQGELDVSVDDLVVVEDGVEQKVESFHEAVSPVSMVLVLDSSGSMRLAAEAATDAARGFIRAIRPTDALAVVIFSDKVTFMHDLTTERWRSFEAIGQYVASGGTALYDAMMDSLGRLKKVQGRRAVVVVTDGRDEDNPGTGPGSISTFPEVMKLLRETGAMVFGVGLGPRVDRFPLTEMAKASGGQAYFPADVAALAVEYQNIVENLRRRWVLSYASTNSKRDGTWRNVEIRLRSSDTPLTSAGGYFAPEK